MRKGVSGFLAVCIFVLSPVFLLAQENIETKLKQEGYVLRDTIGNVKSLTQLHNWFTRKQMGLYREILSGIGRNETPNLLIPVGIYRLRKIINNPKVRWETKLFYETTLWTTNIGIGYYRQLTDNLFLSPFAYFGGGDRDIKGIEVPADFNVGVGMEFGYWMSQKVSGYGGFSFNLVTPGSPDSGKVDQGQGLSIYGGLKFFLTNKRKVSINLAAGYRFWGGFTYKPSAFAPGVNIVPENYYFLGGLSLYRSASMDKIVDNRWRPFEIGMFYSSTLRTANLKILKPYALFQELSIAPFIGYGENIKETSSSTSSDTSGRSMDMSLTAGVELRLFGKNLEKYANNPYIGIKGHYVVYDYPSTVTPPSPQNGYGWSAYIGTRWKIFHNLALDVNIGRVFWADNYPGPKPDDFLFNAGLIVSFGGKAEELKLRGKVLIKEVEAGKPLPRVDKYNPLTDDALDEYDGEIRTYAKREEAETTIFGNLTNLSFIDYFGTAFKIQDSELLRFTSTRQQEMKINVTVKQSPKKVVILLNRDRIDIEKLKRAELYLCFTDYAKNRYFGFYFDKDGELKPEFETQYELGDTVTSRQPPHNIYMGDFKRYTAKIDWLENYKDESGLITPMDVKQTVLTKYMLYHNLDTSNVALKNALLSKYAFAYAVCDISMLKDIEKFLGGSELGYAVLAAKDFNSDGIFQPQEDGTLGFDPKDDFVFSNHEKASKFEAIPDTSCGKNKIRLDHFGECETELLYEHVVILKRNVDCFLHAKGIRIVGYHDASIPTQECLKKFPAGNPEIAKARAEAVKRFLVEKLDVDPEIIIVEPGQLSQNAEKCAPCRMVDIEVIPNDETEK